MQIFLSFNTAPFWTAKTSWFISSISFISFMVSSIELYPLEKGWNCKKSGMNEHLMRCQLDRTHRGDRVFPGVGLWRVLGKLTCQESHWTRGQCSIKEAVNVNQITLWRIKFVHIVSYFRELSMSRETCLQFIYTQRYSVGNCNLWVWNEARQVFNEINFVCLSVIADCLSQVEPASSGQHY